ncbi:MAG TPA: hypothetical protein PKM88_07990 [bacterium]|nr:hypothetical protein [bacterium]
MTVPDPLTITELLARTRAACPPPSGPLAARLIRARRRWRLIPWWRIGSISDAAAFYRAAYRACLGRNPSDDELAELTAQFPATKAARLAYLRALRTAPEAQARTVAPGLWLAALTTRLLAL